ncbi:MAG: glycine cleavage system protein GcvH [Bacteroidetes bacterium]|jgi:glycine cleavage system H protein|nr:glycine cleavage system protein GcvH [Bacteroidota bacterium]
MDFPDDLYYTEDHEWLRLSDDGATATVGITDFAQGELGDIVFVEVEPDGTTLGQDEVFGTVEAVKTVSELYMPVSGTLQSFNEALEATPELVNDDPYNEGWMVTIAIEDADDVDKLMSSEDYASMVG